MRQIVRVPFLATAPLLVIQCFVWRGNGMGVLRMAVDTGSSFVIIKPEILLTLGYDLTVARPMTIYGIHAQALTAPQVTLERFGVIGGRSKCGSLGAKPSAPSGVGWLGRVEFLAALLAGHLQLFGQLPDAAAVTLPTPCVPCPHFSVAPLR
ncbi:MAG: hypothetical protein HZLCBSQH_001360 [Candidatus Fervidibacterota bacterium]